MRKGMPRAEIKKFYDSRAWKAIRLQILARCQDRCEIRSPKCTKKATEVDHIVPLADDQSKALDPTNLRGSCKSCNSSRSSHQKQNSGYLRMAGQITLVVGKRKDHPELRVGPRDVVLDYEEILAAFGATKGAGRKVFARYAWESIMKQLRRGELDAASVWIFSTDGDAIEKYPHHELIDLGRRDDDVAGSEGRGIVPGRW